MLPLAGPEFPRTHAALATAIREGLARFGIAARDVTVEGGTFPAIDLVRVDLSGAKVTRELRLPKPGEPSPTERIAVAHIEVIGAPLLFETTPLQLELRTAAAQLASSRSAAGEPTLTLAAAAGGHISIAAVVADLERLAQTLIASAASQQGVEIRETKVRLNPRGPRSADFEIEVTAKMFVMTAKVAVGGTLTIDDEFNARLSNLGCRGDGMLASAASGLLKPHFQRLENRTFPLLALSLGEVKLRDIALETSGDALRLRAEFGS